MDCGRGERTRTFDLTVPNRARYQLRHTPIGVSLQDYTLVLIRLPVGSATSAILKGNMKWFTHTPKQSEPVTKREVSYFGGIVILFIILTSWTIGTSSIWFDEAFGAFMIQFSYADIAYYTGRDVHPPLYYWFLKSWGYIFGASDIGLRSMSVLFGVTTLISAYALVRKLLGWKAALGAVFALAVSPIAIRYGQEARMYTMVATIGFSGTYVLLKALETNAKKWWLLYALFVSAGMWTHYLAVLFWLSHWVWRAIVTHNPKILLWLKSFFTKGWILSHILAILLFLPWMSLLLKSLADVQTNGFWIPPLSLQSVADVAGNFFLYEDSGKVTSWQTVLVVLVGIIILYIAMHTFRTFSKQQKINFSLMLSIAFVPPALLMLASLPPLESSFISRYIVPSIMTYSLIIGSLFVYARQLVPRATYLATGLLVVLTIMGASNVYAYGNFNKTENRSSQAKQVIESIRSSVGPIPIIASGGFFFYEAHQYSMPESQVYFIDGDTDYIYGSLEMLRLNDEGKIKDLGSFKDTHQSFWYIGRTGTTELALPDETNIVKVKSMRFNDRVTSEPAYQAVLYQTTAE